MKKLTSLVILILVSNQLIAGDCNKPISSTKGKPVMCVVKPTVNIHDNNATKKFSKFNIGR